MLNEEPTDQVLNLHLDVLNLAIGYELQVELFVIFEQFLFEFQVVHEVLARNLGLPLQLQVVTRDLLLD